MGMKFLHLKFSNGNLKIKVDDDYNLDNSSIPNGETYRLLPTTNYRNGYRIKKCKSSDSPLTLVSLIYPNLKGKSVIYNNNDFSDLRKSNICVKISSGSILKIYNNGIIIINIGNKNSDTIKKVKEYYQELLFSYEYIEGKKLTDLISNKYSSLLIDSGRVPNIYRIDRVYKPTLWVFCFYHCGKHYRYQSEHPVETMRVGDMIKISVKSNLNPWELCFNRESYSVSDIEKINKNMHLYIKNSKGITRASRASAIDGAGSSKFRVRKISLRNYGLRHNNVGKGKFNSIICRLTIPNSYIKKNPFIKYNSGSLIITCPHQDSLEKNKYVYDIGKRILSEEFGVPVAGLMYPEMQLSDFPKSDVSYVRDKIIKYVKKHSAGQ